MARVVTDLLAVRGDGPRGPQEHACLGELLGFAAVGGFDLGGELHGEKVAHAGRLDLALPARGAPAGQMNLAAGFDVFEPRGLQERGAATRAVVEALFVLLHGDAAEQDVGVGGAEAHGRDGEDGEADEHLDEREGATFHRASTAGNGAQVKGSMGITRRPSSRVTSRRTRSHVPSG